MLASQTETLSSPPEIASELTIQELIEMESPKHDVDPKLAAAIAFCESTSRQFKEGTQIPLRGVHNPYDVGLFQINERFHYEKSQALGYDINTLEGNLGYALWLIENEGSRHWKASEPCWSKIANA